MTEFRKETTLPGSTGTTEGDVLFIKQDFQTMTTSSKINSLYRRPGPLRGLGPYSFHSSFSSAKFPRFKGAKGYGSQFKGSKGYGNPYGAQTFGI